MKRILLIIGISIFYLADTMGQQIPLYSQYQQNPFLYNPARTGERDHTYLYGIYRRQWTDIAGSPETIALTVDGPLKSKKIGLGAYLYSDRTDLIERLGGNFSYAYFFNFDDDHRLSLGLSAGIQQIRVNMDMANPSDANDPLLQSNLKSGITFDGNVGFNYFLKGFNLGFSVPQLIQTNVQDLNSNSALDYQMARHYLLMASYEISLADDKFFIEPGAMFRMTKGGEFQVDGFAQFSYKRLAWLSVGYRYDYALTVGAGVQIHDRLSLGYATDISMNGLQGYTSGTHEVMLGLKFGKRDDSGVIEAIQRLEEGQKQNREDIEKIDERNEGLLDENKSQKELIEEQKEEIARLKRELEQKLQAFSDSLKKATGKDANLPSDAVYEGSEDELEFITGEPDNNYFMVVSSLRTEDKAREIAMNYKKQGHDVGVVLNKRRSWYYVFLSKPGDFDDGIKELYKLRNSQPDFQDAWIHIYK